MTVRVGSPGRGQQRLRSCAERLDLSSRCTLAFGWRYSVIVRKWRASERCISALLDQFMSCFGLGFGLFFVSQGVGRGFVAMSANAARLIVSAGAGLAAVYGLGLGITSLFVAVAVGFGLYASFLVYAVLRVKPDSAAAAVTR